MAKRLITLLIVTLLIIGGVISLLNSRFSDRSEWNNSQLESQQNETEIEKKDQNPINENDTQTFGRYIDYSDEAATNTDYETTVLFYHAPWCPQCRAFETNINSGGVPAGVQVLRVDYDTATDLKQKHGVTIQTTFVKVDAQGNQISKWIGYSEEKTIRAALRGLETN